MLYRATLLLLATGLLAAAPAPKTIAPDTLVHANAIFLRTLSADGARTIHLRAKALGNYFFIEEASGVTVYSYGGSDYKKVDFLKGAKLAGAMKKYK